jgi:EpsI family protein
MAGRWREWIPVLVLIAGAALVRVGGPQQSVPLRAPLGEVIPWEIAGYTASDLDVSAEELEVAGTTSHLLRAYRAPSAATPFFTLYVGYHDSQAQGRTLHSPRNCLPGAGWEALQHQTQTVDTPVGRLVVARYLVQRGADRALVFYWYQGRGRVESGEYAVKYQLLRDAALRGRSEEALVRVMVPIAGDVEPSVNLARDVTGVVVPALFRALPET